MEVLAQICEMKETQKQVDASNTHSTPLSGQRAVHFEDDDGSSCLLNSSAGDSSHMSLPSPLQSFDRLLYLLAAADSGSPCYTEIMLAGMFNGSASPERRTLNSSSWLHLLSSPGDGRAHESHDPSATAAWSEALALEEGAASDDNTSQDGRAQRAPAAESGGGPSHEGASRERAPALPPSGSTQYTPPPEMCPPANPWYVRSYFTQMRLIVPADGQLLMSDCALLD